MGLLLDIGAGGLYFVRQFRRLNPEFEFMYLCGEPAYASPWNGVVVQGAIRKVQASYRAFGVPDESLDIVTLNAPHPLTPLGGIESELLRCLKPNGLFISSHPVGWHITLDEEFFESLAIARDATYPYVARFSHQYGWLPSKRSAHCALDVHTSMEYPASETLRDRFYYIRMQRILGEHTVPLRYVYRGLYDEPSVRVWKKRI